MLTDLSAGYHHNSLTEPLPSLLQALLGGAAVPREYSIIPEDGACRYNEPTLRDEAEGPQAYMLGVAGKYAAANVLLDLNPGTLPSGPLDGSALLSSLVVGSREAQDARVRFDRGLTTSVVETVKRTYYRAALNLRNFEPESFTEPFKAAAISLADSSNTSAEAIRFIFEYGNAVLDRAVMVRTHCQYTSVP